MSNGQHWIRDPSRIAIYIRDGWQCVYDGAKVGTFGQDGEAVRLTLDHLIPRQDKGSNYESNLVTACLRCNTLRGTRPWKDMARTSKIAEYIERQVRLPIRVAEAERILASYPSFGACVLAEGRKRRKYELSGMPISNRGELRLCSVHGANGPTAGRPLV
jgi:hypothetical protein